MRFARRYTLLELLVVMAALAILLGFALPSVVGSRAAGRLDQQVQETLALTRKARAWATSEGRTVQLRFEEAGMRLVRARDPLAEAGDDEDPEVEVPVEGAPVWREDYVEGVSLAQLELDEDIVEPSETSLHFFPSGEATAAALTFSAKDLQVRVELDPVLGAARVVDEVIQ